MKYKIKQIKDVDNCEYSFKYCEQCKDKIDLKDYEVAYEGELDCPEVSNTPEELFKIFNIKIPEDFKGRSMSISDIVEIDGKNYYCDMIGWKELK